MKLKEIKTLVQTGAAVDITHEPLENIYKIDSKLDVVALSHGVYGMNGGLFKDRTTGKLYAITSRNGNLFALA